MTVTGLVTALLTGVTVGLLGGLVTPARREVPVWLTTAIGVVAALVGTIAAALAGVDTGALDPWTLIVQAIFAGLCVLTAVVTAHPGRSDAGSAPNVRGCGTEVRQHDRRTG